MRLSAFSLFLLRKARNCLCCGSFGSMCAAARTLCVHDSLVLPLQYSFFLPLLSNAWSWKMKTKITSILFARTHCTRLWCFALSWKLERNHGLLLGWVCRFNVYKNKATQSSRLLVWNSDDLYAIESSVTWHLSSIILLRTLQKLANSTNRLFLRSIREESEDRNWDLIQYQ